MLTTEVDTQTAPASLSRSDLHQIKTMVEEGVRLGRLPERIGTRQAEEETGLSARALHRLREKGRISYMKTTDRGVITYNTRRLFEELDALEIPTKTNGLTALP